MSCVARISPPPVFYLSPTLCSTYFCVPSIITVWKGQAPASNSSLRVMLFQAPRRWRPHLRSAPRDSNHHLEPVHRRRLGRRVWSAHHAHRAHRALLFCPLGPGRMPHERLNAGTDQRPLHYLLMVSKEHRSSCTWERKLSNITQIDRFLFLSTSNPYSRMDFRCCIT